MKPIKNVCYRCGKRIIASYPPDKELASMLRQMKTAECSVCNPNSNWQREEANKRVNQQKSLEQKRSDRPCPDCKGTGMGQFYFNKNAPCDTCKGTGQRGLDRPDREKIADILKPLVRSYVLSYIHNLNQFDTEIKRVEDCYLAQLLALFPDEREIEEACFERWLPNQEKAERMIEEVAKCEERERIIEWIKERATKIGDNGGYWGAVDWDTKNYLEIEVVITPEDWQALKGE